MSGRFLPLSAMQATTDLDAGETGADTVIKSELVHVVAERNQHLFVRDVEIIVDTIFNEITNALGNGGRVELRGFGAFTVKHRPAHAARNPHSGEAVDVVEKWIPAFRAGKGIRDRLNNRD